MIFENHHGCVSHQIPAVTSSSYQMPSRSGAPVFLFSHRFTEHPNHPGVPFIIALYSDIAQGWPHDVPAPRPTSVFVPAMVHRLQLHAAAPAGDGVVSCAIKSPQLHFWRPQLRESQFSPPITVKMPPSAGRAKRLVALAADVAVVQTKNNDSYNFYRVSAATGEVRLLGSWLHATTTIYGTAVTQLGSDTLLAVFAADPNRQFDRSAVVYFVTSTGASVVPLMRPPPIGPAALAFADGAGAGPVLVVAWGGGTVSINPGSSRVRWLSRRPLTPSAVCALGGGGVALLTRHHGGGTALQCGIVTAGLGEVFAVAASPNLMGVYATRVNLDLPTGAAAGAGAGAGGGIGGEVGGAVATRCRRVTVVGVIGGKKGALEVTTVDIDIERAALPPLPPLPPPPAVAGLPGLEQVAELARACSGTAGADVMTVPGLPIWSVEPAPAPATPAPAAAAPAAPVHAQAPMHVQTPKPAASFKAPFSPTPASPSSFAGSDLVLHVTPRAPALPAAMIAVQERFRSMARDDSDDYSYDSRY